MTDIFIFGTGRFYERRKALLYRDWGIENVAGFLDNRRTGMFEGKTVQRPSEEFAHRTENILLMSASSDEMRQQLLELGVASERILSWEEFSSRIQTGRLRIFSGQDMQSTGKRILFIHIGLFYNGAAIAAINACLALKARGYDVSLAVPGYDDALLAYTCGLGIMVIHCPTLPWVLEAERCWIRTFNIVIVNVYQMMAAVCEIMKFRPVLWWIHEADDVHSHLYSQTRERYPEYAEEQQFDGVRILAVNAIGKRAFEEYYPQRIDGILPYGVPNEVWNAPRTKKEDCIGVAILGAIFPLKGQDIFLEAIRRLPEEARRRGRFYLIGELSGSAEYNRKIKTEVGEMPGVELTGQMTRRDLKRFYSNIDVVVSASLVDNLPVVVTEGLMNGRICIVTDAVGHAQEAIRDGENGFICKAGDAESLAEKMAYVIEHIDELGPMREKARKTYEKYFSMKVFGERLERELLLTERKYWERKKKE